MAIEKLCEYQEGLKIKYCALINLKDMKCSCSYLSNDMIEIHERKLFSFKITAYYRCNIGGLVKECKE